MPNFERPGDEIRMPKAKKRALSTTSESEGETNQNQTSASPVKAKKKKTNDEKKVKSTTASSSSDEQGKAAKKAKKEKKEEKKEVSQPIKEVEKKKLPTVAVSGEDEAGKKPIIKTTTVKDMLRAKRDNLRKMEAGKSSGGTTTTTDNDEDDGTESVSSLAVSESSRESNSEVQVVVPQPSSVNGTKELSLPSNFAPELIQSITSLKSYAETTAKHNSNFFDNHVKEQLLKVDALAKIQGPAIQLQVYKQLETFIPCQKKQILSKVNRFRTQKAEGKVKAEVKKLKSAVNSIMPDLVRKYDEDLKDFEGKKNINHIIGSGSPMEHKAPRRKFHWNDNLRQILYDITQLVADLHKISKFKKEPLDDFTTKYLKENVLPIWPEAWIKLEDFNKELDRKKKRESRAASSPQTSTPNGKNSTQKTESPSNLVNGKSPTSLSQHQQSVIKKSSDHSINSIMSSSSPSPPSHHSSSSKAQADTSKSTATTPTTHVIELEKLSSPSELLKVSKIPKFNHQDVVSPEKNRVSDGSDSDCIEIFESPLKAQSTSFLHLNNNKLSHPPPSQQQQQQPQHQQQEKESKNIKKSEDYSNLINSFEMLTVRNYF